jgi:uncharacterized membrane protein YphA (DoxX/SURF4 family)
MKSKVQFVLCLLTGLLFINAGLDKFIHYMPVPDNLPPKMVKVMQAFNQIEWLMPLVGAAEVVGGLLLIFRRTRPLGALVLTPLLVGILLANFSMAPSGLPIVVILIAVVAWVIIDNREKYLPIIR